MDPGGYLVSASPYQCELSAIGFNASEHANQTDDSILLMRLILSLGTVFFSLLPLHFIRFYHIDAKHCLQTQKILAAKHVASN